MAQPTNNITHYFNVIKNWKIVPLLLPKVPILSSWIPGCDFLLGELSDIN